MERLISVAECRATNLDLKAECATFSLPALWQRRRLFCCFIFFFLLFLCFFSRWVALNGLVRFATFLSASTVWGRALFGPLSAELPLITVKLAMFIMRASLSAHFCLSGFRSNYFFDGFSLGFSGTRHLSFRCRCCWLSLGLSRARVCMPMGKTCTRCQKGQTTKVKRLNQHY